MLGHLFASDYLSEALVQLFLEEDLRLGPIYKYLSDKLGLVNNLLLTASF